MAALLFSGCSTTTESTNSTPQATEKSTATKTNDYAILAGEVFDQIFSSKNFTAKDFVRTFYNDPSGFKEAILDYEIAVGSIYFKLKQPYETISNIDGELTSFFVKHDTANFVMRTSPYKFDKSQLSGDLHLKCLSDSQTHNRYTKLLVFRSCQVVKRGI